MCDRRNHKLVEISRTAVLAGAEFYRVVRWCEDCGAIVVDLDVD